MEVTENVRSRTTKRAALGAALAAVLVMGGALTASAGTEFVGGGTFHYNADATLNWCNYHHPSKKHRCTVENRFGSVRSPDAAAGLWAYQSQPVARTGNKVWWHVY